MECSNDTSYIFVTLWVIFHMSLLKPDSLHLPWRNAVTLCASVNTGHDGFWIGKDCKNHAREFLLILYTTLSSAYSSSISCSHLYDNFFIGILWVKMTHTPLLAAKVINYIKIIEMIWAGKTFWLQFWP